MPQSLSPSNANILRGGTQDYTLAGFTNDLNAGGYGGLKALQLIASFGTVSRVSGKARITAPNSDGTGKLQVYSLVFNESVNNPGFNGNGGSESRIYWSAPAGNLAATGQRLSSAGDYCEFSPWSDANTRLQFFTGLKSNSTGKMVGINNNSVYESSNDYSNNIGGNANPTTNPDDIFRFTLRSDGKIDVAKNGTFVFTTLQSGYENSYFKISNVAFGSGATTGASMRMPVFVGSGISNYEYAETNYSVVQTLPDSTPPSAPVLGNPTVTGQSTASIPFTAGVDAETGVAKHHFYFSPNPDFSGAVYHFETTGASPFVVPNGGLPANTDLYVKATAINPGALQSADSNTKTLKTWNVAPQIVNTSPITSVEAGAAYDYTFVVSGGDGGSTIDFAPGSSPPAHFSLINGHLVTNTPVSTVPGTYSFDLKVTDSKGQNSTKSFQITVADTTPPAKVTGLTASRINNSQIDGSFNPSSDYSGIKRYEVYLSKFENDFSNANVLNVTVTNFSLQQGLNGVSLLNPANDTTYWLDVRAVDNSTTAGLVGEFSDKLPVYIQASLAITTNSALPNGAQGANYSAQLTKSGGSGAGTWSIISQGAQSASINASGVVSIANAQTGSVTFTARFQDATNNYPGSVNTPRYVDKQFTVTISPTPPTAAFTIPASVLINGSIQAQNNSTGATSYVWQKKLGNGAYSQFSTETNPTFSLNAAGTWTIKVIATNGAGSTEATQTITVTLPAPPIITSSGTLKYGRVGYPYQTELTKTGQGTFSIVTPGNLPSGALGTDGTIIIPALGSDDYNFTVRLTDAYGQYDDADLTIPVSSLAVFDYCLVYPLDYEYTKAVRVFIPRSGPRDRQVRTDTNAKRKLTINIRSFKRSKRAEVIAFWLEHFPSKNFLFHDKDGDEYFEAWISSTLKAPKTGLANSELTFVIEEL